MRHRSKTFIGGDIGYDPARHNTGMLWFGNDGVIITKLDCACISSSRRTRILPHTTWGRFKSSAREPRSATVLPFRRLSAQEAQPFENCVPLYRDLSVAAGAFGAESVVDGVPELGPIVDVGGGPRQAQSRLHGCPVSADRLGEPGRGRAAHLG